MALADWAATNLPLCVILHITMLISLFINCSLVLVKNQIKSDLFSVKTDFLF